MEAGGQEPKGAFVQRGGCDAKGDLLEGTVRWASEPHSVRDHHMEQYDPIEACLSWKHWHVYCILNCVDLTTRINSILLKHEVAS